MRFAARSQHEAHASTAHQPVSRVPTAPSVVGPGSGREGSCLACGRPIRRREDFVRVGRDAVHAECGLYRPRRRRDARRR